MSNTPPNDLEPTAGLDDGEEAAVSALSVGIGTEIGPYRIVGKLGAGGMGTVFAAEQTHPLTRRVAIKVIHVGMDTERLLRRFDAERRILAMLDHPNVSTMLDAGATPQGRPYFVMDHVDGIDILTYCRQRTLTVRQRIVLFLQVLAGIEHAHQKGIIHRDLKPSNVLVQEREGQPVARIIDFGIAKSLTGDTGELTELTAAGEQFGTSAYMSPEQASLASDQLDVRTDIFSLGVILYELLVGASPFDDARLAEDRLRELTSREARKPVQSLRRAPDTLDGLAQERSTSRSVLLRTVTGDVASVLLKALENERARRYRTVSEFGDDLKRYLDGFPVIAKPRRFGYVASRFAQRHKVFIGAAAVVLALLITTTLAAVAGFFQARESAEEARLIAAFQARQLSGIDPAVMGRTLKADLLAELAAAGERAGASPEEIGERVTTVQELLAGANFTNIGLDVLDKNIMQGAAAIIEADFADQPLVQARLRLTLAEAMKSLGLTEAARTQAVASLATRRTLLGPDDRDTLDAQFQTASLAQQLGESTEAEAIARDGVARAERHLGSGDVVTIALYNALGHALEGQARHEEALAVFQTEYDLARTHFGPDDANAILAEGNIGFVLNSMGRFDEAEAYLLRTLVRLRKRYGNEYGPTMNAINNLGFSHWARGNYEAAEPYYREVAALRTRLYGDDHPDSLASIGAMGAILRALDRPEEAVTFYRRALDGSRASLGNAHPYTLRAVHNMAIIQRVRGELDESLALATEALEGRTEALGADHYLTAVSLSSYGETLRDLQRFDEAETALTDAYEQLSSSSGGATYVVRPVRGLVKLYENRQAAEPGEDVSAELERWRGRLAELTGEA
ncbi:MAG: serine/threonine-protein kinase [Pseudomonadota bacterium]